MKAKVVELVQYVLTPEESTDRATLAFTVNRSAGLAGGIKTAFWMGVAVVVSMGIAGLS